MELKEILTYASGLHNSLIKNVYTWTCETRKSRKATSNSSWKELQKHTNFVSLFQCPERSSIGKRVYITNTFLINMWNSRSWTNSQLNKTSKAYQLWKLMSVQFVALCLKVSYFQKDFLVSSILPKNKRKQDRRYILRS